MARATASVLLLLAINIAGCASFFSPKPVEVNTVAVEKTPLNLQLPSPLNAPNINWIIVTPENSTEVFKNLKDDKVIFGMTDQGYEDLSILLAEIRAFIATQQTIILKYKEYYEPPKKEDK